MAHAATALIGGPSHGVSRRVSLGIALAASSFLIYACTVFVLPQVREARYCCEQSNFAAGVSNVIYRARLGSLYSGVFDLFIKHFDEPLAQALEEARRPDTGLPVTPPGTWIPTTLDGNGIGYALIVTAAFRLFGLHAWAPILTMLILMAVSAAVFLCRFSGPYAGIVILYFSALTVMLFTALVWDPAWAVQIPVAGIRYFSLVSVLPMFHILLSLLDRQLPRPGSEWRDTVLLATQTLILVLAILVRGSALPLIGAIAFVGLALAWQHRRNPGRLRLLIRDFAVIGLASLGLLAGIALSVPRQYLTEGRFGTVVWQRVTESLGVNPAFPWPGVKDMFDCKKYVPQGLEAGTADSNGICIWFDYVTRHHIPVDTLGDKTFGKLYETALREAFFKIAARYPGDVLKTFIYYKPPQIVSSITQSTRFNIAGDQGKALITTGRSVIPYSPLAIAFLTLSLCLASAYFSIATISLPEFGRMAAVVLLSALFTIPSYIAAWAMPHTSADLLLCCLVSVGLAFGAAELGIRTAMRRLVAPGSNNGGCKEIGRSYADGRRSSGSRNHLSGVDTSTGR